MDPTDGLPGKGDAGAGASGRQLRARWGSPGDEEWRGTPELVLVVAMGWRETWKLSSGVGAEARYRLIERVKSDPLTPALPPGENFPT